jgi:hypothetical protein
VFSTRTLKNWYCIFQNFLQFSIYFTRISNWPNTIQESALHRGPWKFRLPYKYALSSRLRPWQEGDRSNWVPRPRVSAGWPEFTGSGDGGSQARGGPRPGAHLGLGGGRSWGRKDADGAGQWCCGLAAAAAQFRRQGEHGLANMWHEEHQGVLGDASKVSHDHGSG